MTTRQPRSRAKKYPQPGEMWEWPSDTPLSVYVVAVVRRYSHGRMMLCIRLDNGMPGEFFFRGDNMWERIA